MTEYHFKCNWCGFLNTKRDLSLHQSCKSCKHKNVTAVEVKTIHPGFWEQLIRKTKPITKELKNVTTITYH